MVICKILTYTVPIFLNRYRYSILDYLLSLIIITSLQTFPSNPQHLPTTFINLKTHLVDITLFN